MTMGRPLLSPTGQRTTSPRTIRLTPELDLALQEHMRDTGQSASKTIRDALTAHLNSTAPCQVPDSSPRHHEARNRSHSPDPTSTPHLASQPGVAT